MNNLTFVKGQGGLSRLLPGEDHISGILFYATAPAGWAVGGVPVRQIGTLKQAEDLGVTANNASVPIRVLHYHIQEFFKNQPNSLLWVGIFPAPALPADYDFEDLKTLQQAAGGKIRQAAIHAPIDFATSQVNAIQTVCNTLFAEHTPLVVLYGADFSNFTDYTALPDLRTLAANYVAVILASPGQGAGASLAAAFGQSIPAIGAALGTLSNAAVHENIGWIGKFPIQGSDLDVPALGTGELMSALTGAQQEALSNKGWIFAVKHIGINGSYWNDSHTAVSLSNDYSSLELNRTIDKAVRGIRAALLPQLNSPLRLDPATGRLSPDTVAYFETLAARPVEQMLKDGQVSGYLIFIDPDQNVLQNSRLEVGVTIVPVGVARQIRVTVGFAFSV